MAFDIAPLTNAPAFGATYTVNIPATVGRMDLSLVTTTPGVDVDSYVRYGEPSTGSTYDYVGNSVTGSELITVTKSSTSPLKAGTYYISLAVFSASVRVAGTLRAILSGSLPDVMKDIQPSLNSPSH